MSEVWYVSYGSNMSAARLAAYLGGGVPPGGSLANPGARDPRPPRRSEPIELPGSVYFAGNSPQWGGGIAFYDHTAPGPSYGRAYLVTTAQFTDIAAQEMYRLPQEGDPLEEIVLEGLGGDTHTVGPGRYETLIRVGERDGAPMLTFTSPHGRDHVEHRAPSQAYLAMLADGLREAHGWGDQEVDRYFRRIAPAP